jgi:hypothetical protein
MLKEVNYPSAISGKTGTVEEGVFPSAGIRSLEN